jgi:hypothetical protein
MLQSNVRRGLCTVQFCHVVEFSNLKVVITHVTIQESSMNRVHKRFDSYQTKRDGSLIFKKILSWECNMKRINCSLLVRFTIWFLQMFLGRFAIVARVWLCKSNEWKLVNMKNEPKNTYILYGPAHDFKSITHYYRTIMSFEMVFLSEVPCSISHLLPLWADTALV